MEARDVEKVIKELQETDAAILKNTIVSVNYVIMDRETFENLVRNSRSEK